MLTSINKIKFLFFVFHIRELSFFVWTLRTTLMILMTLFYFIFLMRKIIIVNNFKNNVFMNNILDSK